MTTVHANDPGNALSRLRTMVGYANADLGRDVIVQQIGGVACGGLIVHVERMRDGGGALPASWRSTDARGERSSLRRAVPVRAARHGTRSAASRKLGAHAASSRSASSSACSRQG